MIGGRLSLNVTFVRFDYQYVRKRQSKGEARRNAGVKHTGSLSPKEELAQAVAACDLDPLTVREGKEQLFEEGVVCDRVPLSSDPAVLSPALLAGEARFE